MSRADRVAELIKHEISDIITRKVNDPRVGFTSITSVDLGGDLQNATVHVSVMGNEEQQKDTMDALRHATGFIRSELSHRMQIRDVPELYFKQDKSIEKAARVFEIMNELEKEKTETPVKAHKVTKGKTRAKGH